MDNDNINFATLRISIEARIQAQYLSVSSTRDGSHGYYVASITFNGHYFSDAHEAVDVAKTRLAEKVLEWCQGKIEDMRVEKQKKDDEDLLRMCL